MQWTPEEDEIIRNFYPASPKEENGVSKNINKTNKKVIHRARTLGVVPKLSWKDRLRCALKKLFAKR